MSGHECPMKLIRPCAKPCSSVAIYVQEDAVDVLWVSKLQVGWDPGIFEDVRAVWVCIGLLDYPELLVLVSQANGQLSTVEICRRIYNL